MKIYATQTIMNKATAIITLISNLLIIFAIINPPDRFLKYTNSVRFLDFGCYLVPLVCHYTQSFVDFYFVTILYFPFMSNINYSPKNKQSPELV